MFFLKTHPRARRTVALVLLSCYLPSCTNWHTQRAGVETVVESRQPDKIQIMTHYGDKFALANPRIEGDSLVGIQYNVSMNPPRRAVALSDIRQVALRKTDVGKTVGLVVGLGVAALLVVAASSDNSNDNRDRVPEQGLDFSSCPLVYSWDGTTWRLDSGTFGGAITEGAARTDVDNLIHLEPVSGRLHLRVANELDEVDYLDAIQVLAVDHDPGVTVAPDGQGRIYTVGPLTAPVTAWDFLGRDALAQVRTTDGRSWESIVTGRDPARPADTRDGLILTFPRPAAVNQARLIVDGQSSIWAAYLLTQFVEAHGSSTLAWYDSLDTQPTYRRRVGAMLAREGFLGVSVLVGEQWQFQGFVWEAGPEIQKRQVHALDLTGVTGDSVRVRLESAPGFWLLDGVAMDFSAQRAIHVRALDPISAIDREGEDVLPAIMLIDSTYYRLETGDAAELVFEDPVMVAGKARSYLVRSHGWYRVNTSMDHPANVALLDRTLAQPGAVSQMSVVRMNEALTILKRGL